MEGGKGKGGKEKGRGAYQDEGPRNKILNMSLTISVKTTFQLHPIFICIL